MVLVGLVAYDLDDKDDVANGLISSLYNNKTVGAQYK